SFCAQRSRSDGAGFCAPWLLGSDAGDVDACCAECEAASGDALGDSLTLGTFAVSVGINVSVAGASVEAIGNLLLSKAAAGHQGLESSGDPPPGGLCCKSR